MKKKKESKEKKKTYINATNIKETNIKNFKKKNSKNSVKKILITNKINNDIISYSYVFILLNYYFENNDIKILNKNFYLQNDVLIISEKLIGNILWIYDEEEKKYLGCRIVEIEAYNGIKDKASHAYNNKKTNKNISMYKEGGISYVYLCYGIHACLNIVTNIENVPDAILFRSAEPIYNIQNFILNKYNINKNNINENNIDETNINKYNINETNIDEYNINETNINKYNINENNLNETNIDEYNINENNINKYHIIKNFLNKNNYLIKINNLKKLLKNMNKKKLKSLCSGPGCLTKSTKIKKKHNMKLFYINLKNYNQFHILCNLKYLYNNKFFISLCPSVNDIINFYEMLKEQKKNFIIDIYNEHKNLLLNYFNEMKWNKENLIIIKDKRIGINYAQEATLYEYRFILKNHPSVTFHPKI